MLGGGERREIRVLPFVKEETVLQFRLNKFHYTFKGYLNSRVRGFPGAVGCCIGLPQAADDADSCLLVHDVAAHP